MTNPYESNRPVYRHELKVICVAVIITALVMGVAGWQDEMTQRQKHLEFCQEHPEDVVCK